MIEWVSIKDKKMPSIEKNVNIIYRYRRLNPNNEPSQVFYGCFHGKEFINLAAVGFITHWAYFNEPEIEEKLRACPLCGSNKIRMLAEPAQQEDMTLSLTLSVFLVKCDHCRIKTKSFPTEKEATKHWNGEVE